MHCKYLIGNSRTNMQLLSWKEVRKYSGQYISIAGNPGITVRSVDKAVIFIPSTYPIDQNNPGLYRARSWVLYSKFNAIDITIDGGFFTQEFLEAIRNNQETWNDL